MASLGAICRVGRGEDGAELIEFALVLPLLLIIVGGIIDFGFLFQRYEVLTNAAREGARIAVLPGYTNADVTARVNQYLQAGGVPPAGATVTVGAAQSLNVGSGSCITVRPVTVTFPHQYTTLGPLLALVGGGLGTTTMTATSTMRNEIGAGACP